MSNCKLHVMVLNVVFVHFCCTHSLIVPDLYQTPASIWAFFFYRKPNMSQSKLSKKGNGHEDWLYSTASVSYIFKDTRPLITWGVILKIVNGDKLLKKSNSHQLKSNVWI